MGNENKPAKRQVVTGRFSSTKPDPPYQNIPIQTPEGRRIRELFRNWRMPRGPSK